MPITIHGHGSISAAAGDYVQRKPRWSIDPATGLPVYRISALNPVGLSAEFVAAEQLDRSAHLALLAAERAVISADWQGKDFAILVGCSRGPTTTWETEFRRFQAQGTAAPRTSPRTTLGGIGFALARYLGVSSLATSLSVTCSSGFHALLHGVALLRAGMVDRVLVGGTEAPLTDFTLRQLQALRIYAKLPASATHACRPFADPASGMVVGEGAAFFALSCEAVVTKPTLTAVTFAQEKSPSLTGISPDGLALEHTMRQAVVEHGATPDLVIAHAPGTRRGDAAERSALNSVLENVPITSGKWATGHTFGASGPLGLDLGLRILKRGSAKELGYFPVKRPVESVLVNATGFGGNVVSVMAQGARPQVQKPDEALRANRV
ncbi:MAG: beta-ketoacyl synthase N-terminal-like domain-containing protein [Bacteroidota bacterium]